MTFSLLVEIRYVNACEVVVRGLTGVASLGDLIRYASGPGDVRIELNRTITKIERYSGVAVDQLEEGHVARISLSAEMECPILVDWTLHG